MFLILSQTDTLSIIMYPQYIVSIDQRALLTHAHGFSNEFGILRSHCKLHINSTKKELHILQGLGKHKTKALSFYLWVK